MDKKTTDNARKLSFFDFLATLKWLFVFNFKLSPGAAISQILTRTILDLSPLFNAYIFAKLIDKILKIISSPGTNLNDVIPLLILLLAYNLSISALQSVYSYVYNVMAQMTSYRVPIIFAKHINSLGIQTLENPEVTNKIERAKENSVMMNGDLTDYYKQNNYHVDNNTHIVYNCQQLRSKLIFVRISRLSFQVRS